MRHLDLFSGIGGFSLAASWVWGEEHDICCFVEIDKFCQKVLKKYWPSVPCVEDINDMERVVAYAKSRGIDLATGGPPCQSASCAGKRKGRADDRFLWDETLDVVEAVKPRWIVFENPTGFLTLNKGVEYEAVLSRLESQGYWVQGFILPACAVGAPHRRDRVFIVAHRESFNEQRSESKRNRIGEPKEASRNGNRHASDTNWTGPQIREVQPGDGGEEQPAIVGNHWDEHWHEALARIHALDDGISRKLAGPVPRRPKGWRVNALKACGNSVVVPLVREILQAIRYVDEEEKKP